MDYLNFNNYARIIAREYSLASTEQERENLKTKYNTYKDKAAGVYLVTVEVTDDSEDVTVKINFKRERAFLIMPEEFNIVYSMKLEETDEDTT